jgi:PhnB protein
MLDCGTEEEARRCYEKLSEDGTPLHPLERTFRNALFGDLTDKFGIPWLIHYQNK